jgi:hypothetical protein
MKVSQRKKLQVHYFTLVESTEVNRLKQYVYKDLKCEGVTYKERYIESQAMEEATRNSIKMILGEEYWYQFFYNKSIEVLKETYIRMTKAYNL